ncbi:MAG: 2-C-methyl-D-erythritol 4-phosphate cytidylyltransferase [Phycisphaerales bacterium]
MNVAVIIAAAGASRRFSEAAAREQGVSMARSKLDEDLGGRPVLQRTIELFNQRPEVTTIIVAGPADAAGMEEFKLRYADKLAMLGCKLCEGGKTHRWETIRNALALVPQACTHVAVHDGARPCTPPDMIDRVFEAAAKHAAVIPAVSVPDTLKRVAADDLPETEIDPLAAILGADAVKKAGVRVVEATVDRAALVAAQTPQVFARALLVRAYAQKDLSGTDDAQLVERLGERVVMVQGNARNIKITLPNDVVLARAIIGARPPSDKPAHMRF